MIKYREGFIYLPGRGSEYHVRPRIAGGSTYPGRPFSYLEAISAVGEATRKVDFPAYDGPVIRMGVGNVSAIVCQDLVP